MVNINDMKSDNQTKNLLNRIFNKQEELMVKYKEIEGLPNWPVDIHLLSSQKCLKDFMQRGVEELAEAFEAWEDGHEQHFREELVDALHFFVELAILAGRKAEDYQNIDDIQGNLGSFITIEDHLWNVTYRYGIAVNLLKNKPWKKDQQFTDEKEFVKRLDKAFNDFMNLLYGFDLDGKQIYDLYMQKHQVNKFRQDSDY